MLNNVIVRLLFILMAAANSFALHGECAAPFHIQSGFQPSHAKLDSTPTINKEAFSQIDRFAFLDFFLNEEDGENPQKKDKPKQSNASPPSSPPVDFTSQSPTIYSRQVNDQRSPTIAIYLITERIRR